MSDNWVEIEDGSRHPVEHTNVCSICHKRKLLDDAKSRGKRIVCYNCAVEKNINHCRVCGKRIPFFGGSKERTKCIKCSTKTSQEDLNETKYWSLLRDVFQDVEKKHYGVACILVSLGESRRGLKSKRKECLRTWDVKRQTTLF